MGCLSSGYRVKKCDWLMQNDSGHDVDLDTLGYVYCYRINARPGLRIFL